MPEPFGSLCSQPPAWPEPTILLNIIYIILVRRPVVARIPQLLRPFYGLVSMSVGAIRLFLGSFTSSLSLSLASLLAPATLPLVLLGVSGGVVIGIPVTLPELAAAIPGTLPEMRVGLLTTPAGTVLDWVVMVAIEDVEFDLVGDEGR